ncbi:MAG: hypothetical protein WDA22_01520 [Bacteroidota bacterium]
MSDETTYRISSILGREPISRALYDSISAGLNSPNVHLARSTSVWDVFDYSLKSAIRDIESHPRGYLFRRLIEYGPHNPEKRKTTNSDGKTVLSDTELGFAINVIFFSIINRFKGELAELLSIKPCVELLNNLIKSGEFESTGQLYFGDTIKERSRKKITGKEFGGYTKGADGLIVSTGVAKSNGRDISVDGVIEIKSMKLSRRKLLEQIQRHIIRLKGGLKLQENEYHKNEIKVDPSKVIKIIIEPSQWKLNREWRRIKTDNGSRIEFWELDEPDEQDAAVQINKRVWKITLGWSEESIEQVAYDMTYWYMSQVGKYIYSSKDFPKGWEGMSPDEAGYNAIKMMLYYAPLRPLNRRKQQRAIKLYNAYSFNYICAIDNKTMIWPEDFASYKITEEVLERLKIEKVPDNVIGLLQKMLNQSITGVKNLKKQLVKTIGKEKFIIYRTLILKYSEYFNG